MNISYWGLYPHNDLFSEFGETKCSSKRYFAMPPAAMTLPAPLPVCPIDVFFFCAFQPLDRRLPNREYLIPAGGFEEKRALLGLADILFAYAYDHRTTGGDATVESAWTVAVLSPLLTWLEVRFGSLDDHVCSLRASNHFLYPSTSIPSRVRADSSSNRETSYVGTKLQGRAWAKRLVFQSAGLLLPKLAFFLLALFARFC